MITRLWTAILLTALMSSGVAWLCLWLRERGLRPVRELGVLFRRQTKVGRIVLGTLFIAMWVFASTKPGSGGGNGDSGDGGTNGVPQMVGGGIVNGHFGERAAVEFDIRLFQCTPDGHKCVQLCHFAGHNIF